MHIRLFAVNKTKLVVICFLLLISIILISGKASCVSKRDTVVSDSSSVFQMISPAHNAIEVAYQSPLFIWTAYSSPQNYILQIDGNDDLFTNPLNGKYEATFFTPLYVNEVLAPDTTSFTLPTNKLQRNKTYWWRILAVDINTLEAITATNAACKFTTANSLILPEAFALISPGNTLSVTGLTPVLTWEQPVTVDDFLLQIDNNNAFTSSLLAYTATITNTPSNDSTVNFSIPADKLTRYTTYYWRVFARNNTGSTMATGAPWSFYTLGPAPGAFTLITPTYNSVQSVLTPTFEWNESTDAQSYLVEISITNTFNSVIFTATGIAPASPTVSYTIPSSANLQVRQKYYWRVQAINGTVPANVPELDRIYGSISVTSIVSFPYNIFTAFTPNLPPDSFTLSQPSNGITNMSHSQIFSWIDSIGELRYTLQISSNPNFSPIVYEDSQIPTDMIDTSMRPITPGILLPGTLYYWRVIAVNSADQTTATGAPWSFRTVPWIEDVTLSMDQRFPGRAGHTAIWTGTEMIIWGGKNETTWYNTGYKFNPILNEWIEVRKTSAPASRSGHTAVYNSTNKTMLIWGGRDSVGSFNTGGIYDIASDSWLTGCANFINLAGAGPVSRTDHTAIWVNTTSTMYIFGGKMPAINVEGLSRSGAGDPDEYSDAYFAYSPGADTWTAITMTVFDGTANALGGRIGHTAIWGNDDGGADAYLPKINGVLATGSNGVPPSPGRNDGKEMYIFGGYNGVFFLNDSARYSPEPKYMDWKKITADLPCPSARYKHTAVWTGKEMIIWGGQAGGAFLNDGARFYPGIPPGYSYGAWPDIIGYSSATNPNGNTQYITGFTYSNINGWTTTNALNAPTPRSGHTAVWDATDSSMIIWGGRNANDYHNTGGIYNRLSESWTSTSTVNAPQPRDEHTTVWTGTEMIVWGGKNDTTYYADGGRFNPSTGSWTPLIINSLSSSRQRHTAVWTGTEMIIWGGDAGITATYNTGSKYYPSNPISNRWASVSGNNAPTARTQHTAVYNAGTMIVWGGASQNTDTGVITWFNTGSTYNIGADNWTTINNALANTPISRAGHTAIWTGTKMVVWGGAQGTNYLNDGGLYTPGAPGTWATISTTDVPATRSGHTAVWDSTDSKMLVWGGYNEVGGQTIRLNTGGIYYPTTDTWVSDAITTTGAPAARAGHTALWITGTGMVIWGGEQSKNNPLGNGGVYSPTANSWTSINPTGAPTPRAFHSAVWSGTEMIVFNGWNGTVYLNDGGRYNPILNSWKLFDTNTPSTTTRRAFHTAIWDTVNNQMITWGGAILGGYTDSGVRFIPVNY
ncbi:MAG: hypothetical protein V1701_01095 [Planctomycetota bacterium]